VGAALLGPASSAVGPALDLSQPVAISADAAEFAFAEALADPCLVLDRRGVALHANAAARQQYPSVANGLPITLSLRNPELVQAIDQVLRQGVTRSVEMHETLPSETWDKLVVSPLHRPEQDWLADEDRQLVVTF